MENQALTKPSPKPLTLRQRIESDDFKTQVARALPRHLTPDRFIRVAATAIMRTPLLAECDQVSFYNALLTLSQLGLEPDGRRAHLIPFRNNKRNCVECQLIVDYKGLAELAMRSGVISFLHADIVCEEDGFGYDRGQIISHSINFRKPRGPAYAVYALARFKDGSEKSEVMSMEDVEAIRKRSRAGNNGPWVTDFAEMAKKTVFRRLSKWLPLSPEFRDAAETDDDVIDIPARNAELGETFTPPAIADATASAPAPKRGRPRKVDFVPPSELEANPNQEEAYGNVTNEAADAAATAPQPSSSPTMVDEPMSFSERLAAQMRVSAVPFDQLQQWMMVNKYVGADSYSSADDLSDLTCKKILASWESVVQFGGGK